MAQLHEGNIQLLGEEIEKLILFQITQPRQGLAQLTAGFLLLLERSLELVFRNDPRSGPEDRRYGFSCAVQP